MSFMRHAVVGTASFAFACVALGAGSAEAGQCRDPWVTQAVRQVTGHEPNGQAESGECSILNYGNGHWGDYNDLVSKVRARFGSSARSGAPQSVLAPGNPIVRQNGNSIISNDGASAISHDGGSAISHDGGSFRR